MTFAPCREVGGKRFSYLSPYLQEWAEEYVVLARRDRQPIEDPSAYEGPVERVRMWPPYPPERGGALVRRTARIWNRWLCVVDPYCGWVLPALSRGLRLCRRHRINLIVVTAPFFSAFIPATILSKISGARLVLDYRDPWTNHVRNFPGIFGARLSRYVERQAIRRASAAVFCTDIMKEQFVAAFGDIAPERLEVIYNGFEPVPIKPEDSGTDGKPIEMVYAGNFYGARRLSVLAPVLAEMLRDGELSPDDFRFHVYSRLTDEDLAMIRELGLEEIVEVHDLVPYQQMRDILRRSDILFLLSGDDVQYAVPFKFFDYLWAGRPMLVVAPRSSMVARLMDEVDCGELADFESRQEIRQALSRLIASREGYSFDGAERFYWSAAAKQYIGLLDAVLQTPPSRSGPARKGE